MTTYKQPLQWTHTLSVAVRMTFVLLAFLFFVGLATVFFANFHLQQKLPPPLPATLNKQVRPPIIAVAEIGNNPVIDTDNELSIYIATHLPKSDPIQSLSKGDETAVTSQLSPDAAENFYDIANRKRPLPAETFNQQLTTHTQPIPSASYSQALANAQLIIPSINVAQTVMNIPIRNGEWDISELDAGVGHLTTTGVAPGDDLAMTFVGHATVPGAGEGAFANLPQLAYGEQLIYRWNGFDYTYEVTRILMVTPDQVGTLYEENGNMIMMATCAGWNSEAGAYLQRMVTRAELVSITLSPNTLFR